MEFTELERILTDKIVIALIAYVFGLLTMWAMLSLQQSLDSSDEDTVDHDASAIDAKATPSDNSFLSVKKDAPVSIKVDALKAELVHAKTLLAKQDDEHEKLSDVISTLDGVVTRANGRLKTILETVKAQS